MTPKLYHVVAAAENGVIGKENRLPWHFEADLAHFKKLTMGQTLVMGRRTYESIGRPLPGRVSFVVSRRMPEGGENPRHFNSIERALAAISTERGYIVGGADVFTRTIGRIDGIYLTKIPGRYEGDAFYPGIPGGFAEKSRSVLQEDPRIEIAFYEREKPGRGRGPASAGRAVSV